MRRLLAALMLLLVMFDAMPLTVFAAVRARTPARSCSCCGECHCAHCRVHHPKPAAPAEGVSLLDCAGCSGTRGSDVTLPVVTPYELPGVTPVPAPEAFTHLRAGSPGRPEPRPLRSPDPPPRPAAA